MLFNSYIFVLLFLPVSLSVFYGISKKYIDRSIIKNCKVSSDNRTQSSNKSKLLCLISSSLFFYSFQKPLYTLILISSVLFNYVCSRIICKSPKGLWMTVGVAGNLSLLFLFKYASFTVSNLQHLLGTDLTFPSIILPLGISFYTFQQIGYLIDVYRCTVNGELVEDSFLEYASFVTFFPQMVAGPIVSRAEFLPQLPKSHRFDYEYFARGIEIFIFGLAKKALLADVFGTAVDWGFSNIEKMNSTDAIIVMLCYTLQIYFDFSGYSDMAVGLGKMFHLDLPWNFDSPYKSRSITEFWRRWHITLGRFLREYVYIPLGGSRKGNGKTYRNLLIVFVLCGIWHGAAWTFFLWGLIIAILVCLEKAYDKVLNRLPGWLNWFRTFLTLNLLWILFRSPTLGEAWTFCRITLNLSFLKPSPKLYGSFYTAEFYKVFVNIPGGFADRFPWLLMFTYLAVGLWIVLGCKNTKAKSEQPFTVRRSIWCAILLAWSIVSFTGVSPFLYFNF